jgi:hypothetical protein
LISTGYKESVIGCKSVFYLGFILCKLLLFFPIISLAITV